MTNKIGLKGISFVEFSGPDQEQIARTLKEFGFLVAAQIENKDIQLFKQNDINLILNTEMASFASLFAEVHGPSISSMGWKFEYPELAYQIALERGARPAKIKDYPAPAVYGIGDSLVYFLSEDSGDFLDSLEFSKTQNLENFKGKGFSKIDHLTNNVFQGDLIYWVNFYKNVFEFTDVREFSIQGEKTGLLSYALRSPDGSFCIPINEGTEKKSQINEFLNEYRGPGIQHLAFLSDNLLNSLEGLKETSIRMLDIEPSYYETAFERAPNLEEDKIKIMRNSVLVDGDNAGYLLQIFTQNLFGPIFIELIQRKNHFSFGEGNFQSLFNSIERDQERRGYI